MFLLCNVFWLRVFSNYKRSTTPALPNLVPAGIILPAKVFSNARLDFQNNKKWRFYGKSAKIWCFAFKISLSLLYFSKKFARRDHFLQFFAQLMKRLGTAVLRIIMMTFRIKLINFIVANKERKDDFIIPWKMCSKKLCICY